MKLSKNAIVAIASTVVLIVCAAVTYTETKSEERHTVVITPNQSQTSQSTDLAVHEETTKLTKVTSVNSDKTQNSKSSKTTIQKSSQTTAAAFSFPADINAASFDMLCAVDGIGETTANKILSYRESAGGFKSMYDLLYINGIGEGKLTLLMKYFYVVNDIGSETDSQTTTAQTTKTIKTTYSNVSTYKTSHATEASAERTLKPVNINTASVKELEESLLISREMAEEIIEVRGLISGYTNIRELSMVTNFTNAMLVERRDYILL